MYNPWKLPSKLKIAEYIGSRKDREKYRTVIIGILLPPLFAPIAFFKGGELAVTGIFLVVWCLATIYNHWEEFVQIYRFNRERRHYIFVTFTIAALNAIISILGNWLLIILAGLAMYYWAIFRIEVLFGAEPEIIENM
jgi:hypothetical protein